MKPVVNVLIVTDDFGINGSPHGGFLRWQDETASQAINSATSREFHLGEFCNCLENTSWTGFNVVITKAHRATPAQTGLTEAQLKANRGADVVSFRFDQSFTVNGQTRALADYDMILFFPINPTNPDPARQAEADAIAQFMENGGGVFATGDHWNLGAEIAGLVPRVRSMRRWWSPSPGPHGEPAAPDALNIDRHDTTQPGPDHITNFEDQSDDVPQPITPALYGAGISIKGGYLARRYLPHPLLCSPDGMVTVLPDHMHEGTCEVPSDLTKTFALGGANPQEYPNYIPPNPPAGYVPAPLAPEIVATGTVRPGTTSPALDPVHTGGTIPTHGFTFGVIAAWDGHLVTKGRVVVDSTWHHFFNINLSGDRYLEDDNLPVNQLQKLHGFYVPDGQGGLKPNNDYKMIMWYYRNIVYWLIPASRHQTIWWQSLFDLASQPRFAEEMAVFAARDQYKLVTLDKVFYLGQLAEAYLEKARGSCATFTIQRFLYKPKIPWWEWIEEIVNVWDPIFNKAGGPAERAQWLAAIGAGPQPQAAKTLGLGTAMVAVTALRQELAKGIDAKAVDRIQGVFGEVLNATAGTFSQHLKSGMEVAQRFDRAATAQAKGAASAKT